MLGIVFVNHTHNVFTFLLKNILLMDSFQYFTNIEVTAEIPYLFRAWQSLDFYVSTNAIKTNIKQ